MLIGIIIDKIKELKQNSLLGKITNALPVTSSC